MAHEVETMAYAGEAPWHKLGTKVDHLMTSEEAINAAELGWSVTMQPVFNEAGKRIEGWRAVTRDTDEKIFAVLSDSWQPVQNRDAFKFFDDVVGKKEAYYETAGSLRGGSRIWLLANLKGSLSIQGDEVTRYLTLVNSHDGTLALQMFWTPVRVVCMNTLNMALTSMVRANSFYSRHTANIYQRVYDAKAILGFASKFYEEWEAKAAAMAIKQLPPAKIPLMLVSAFKTTGAIRLEDVGAPTDQMQRVFNRVEALVEVGRGQDNPKIRGTVWAAYNAFVEFVDYDKTYKDKTDATRLYNNWFGTGAELKKKAWEWCEKEI